MDEQTEQVTEPESAQPTAEEFKERFPGAEKQEIPTTRIHECSDGKTRNEEQYQAWKLKKAQFEKDPEMFVHVDDLVMAVVAQGQERAFVFGRYSIGDCKLAFMDLQIKFFTSIQEFEYRMRAKAQQDSIVGADGKPVNKPSPGIIT